METSVAATHAQAEELLDAKDVGPALEQEGRARCPGAVKRRDTATPTSTADRMTALLAGRCAAEDLGEESVDEA